MSALHSVSAASHAAGAEVYDAVVVGAGFAGMYMLHRLRGQGLTVRVYEQGGDVGGTWYWNRYPGARCDVESMQYSFSFSEELQQEWDWSERYAPQPEILKYANHVADRFDLRSDIQFDTCVDRAVFDETARTWSVATSDGRNVTAKYLILATGCLSNARMPDIKGLADFKGKVYHTGHWPHEPVDFTGPARRRDRHGLVGDPVGADHRRTGVSAYGVSAHCEFLHSARNAPLTAEERGAFRTKYPEIRRVAREEARNGIYTEMPDRGALDDGDNERRSKYQARWDRGGLTFMSVYNNLAMDQAANDTAADFVREKIAEIVRDPETARLLQPNDHPIGSKRICIDTDYFATFNRPNVTLVDIRSHPIEEVTADAVRTAAGDYEVDALVLATGFDAMTGSVAKIDIRGRDGQTLNRKWGRGAEDLSRPDERGLSQSVHHHRPRQPVGALEHDRLDRAACRLDHRLHRPYARAGPRYHGGEAGRRGQMGGACQRGRAHHALPAGQFLVHGRQHPGKAADLHALYRRRRGLPPDLQRRCRRGV